jgi:hypothetical protein
LVAVPGQLHAVERAQQEETDQANEGPHRDATEDPDEELIHELHGVHGIKQENRCVTDASDGQSCADGDNAGSALDAPFVTLHAGDPLCQFALFGAVIVGNDPGQKGRISLLLAHMQSMVDF